MGYRSEVALYARHPRVKELFAQYAEHNELFQEALMGRRENTCLRNFKMSEPEYRTPWVLFEWEDIKWYSGSSWIDSTMKFVEELGALCDAEGGDNCVSFCRIGEDSDDVERLFYGDEAYNYVDVSRSMEINI